MEDDQLCNAGANDTDIRELVTDNAFSELTVLLVATEGLRKSFAFESSGVCRSGPNQPPSGVIGGSHTQNMGIERMIMSVNISDQACARYHRCINAGARSSTQAGPVLGYGQAL